MRFFKLDKIQKEELREHPANDSYQFCSLTMGEVQVQQNLIQVLFPKLDLREVDVGN